MVESAEPLCSHPNRRRIQAAMLSLLFMAPLDASAVNILFPVLQREFNLPIERLGDIAWVSVSYLTVIAGLMLPMGRLGDLWGFRRMYLGGGALFVAASVLCALASGLGWLIAARALQGVGACMMMALSPGITTAIFPANERGRAMGIVAMTVALGSIAGPSVGGLVAEAFGWRAVFLMNLPVGAFGLYFCGRTLPALAPTARARPDLPGGALAVVALGALLLAVTEGNAWGWTSMPILGLLALAAGAGLALAAHERRAASPMLDPALLRRRVFLGANLASFANYTGQMCASFLFPVFLQTGLGFSAAHAGLIYAVIPAAIVFIAPASGALSDRFGTRRLSVAGLCIALAGMGGATAAVWAASTMPLSRGEVLAWALPAFFLAGVGVAVFQSPNNSAAMSAVPRESLGVGGGLLAAMRNIGMACGMAIAGAVVGGHSAATGAATQSPALFRSLAMGLLAGTAFVLLALLFSLWRDDAPIARSASA